MDTPSSSPSPEGVRPPEPANKSTSQRLRRALFGEKRDVLDPHLFEHISLVAFLAWVGLGADGLSSSSYGPEEAFKNLGQSQYLAVFLALLTALTVLIIAAAYSKIIEHFPFGGGGYVVATRLLGPKWGVVSGSALLIDYILTITTSIAAGGDAIFSILPASANEATLWKFGPVKMWVEAVALLVLMGMNIRGVKESVTALVPIFLIFLASHVIIIGGAIVLHLGHIPEVLHSVPTGLHRDISAMGALGLMLMFLRAYSLGAGTYTGIEAVSNGLQIMREPRVKTAKLTMVYMAISLAITAGGIIVAYLLVGVHPTPGQTMNYVLANNLAGSFAIFGMPIGKGFVYVTLMSEALLLFVAAQAGFIDGPRVMANMAHDSWLPHRFSALSDRLTMQNGVMLMGFTSLAMLLFTQGQVDALVVLYSINVFVTFSLSQAGMIRYWFMKDTRLKHKGWLKEIQIHVVAFVLCFGILVVNVFEKFADGAWVTVVVTGTMVALCILIKKHYVGVVARLARLDEILGALPGADQTKELTVDRLKPTAVMLVGGFSGLGIHSLLTVLRLFPRYYANVVFMGVGVVDSATFQGVEEVDLVRAQTEEGLAKYAELATRLGVPAEYRMSVGTEAVAECSRLASEVAKEFPRAMFFAGKLIFERERWFDRLLHNETAYAIQRRLQFTGIAMVILPVRVLE
jgi:amino acid transporter